MPVTLTIGTQMLGCEITKGSRGSYVTAWHSNGGTRRLGTSMLKYDGIGLIPFTTGGLFDHEPSCVCRDIHHKDKVFSGTGQWITRLQFKNLSRAAD